MVNQPTEHKSNGPEQLDSKVFSQKEIEAFRDYNEKVTDLDPRFTSLKPRHDLVLVRV
jgi:hypothetical protein